MPRRTGIIEVEGQVVETLPQTLFRVELRNGHRLLAYLARSARLELADLAAGDGVKLELSPYDLSNGRITARQT